MMDQGTSARSPMPPTVNASKLSGPTPTLLYWDWSILVRVFHKVRGCWMLTVHAEGGKKSLQNVLAEIDTYANWDLPYRPTGIFFDGVPAKGNFVSQYETYTTYARGKGFTIVSSS